MTGRAILAEYFTTDDLTLLFIGRADFEEPVVHEIPRSQAEIRHFVQEYFGNEQDDRGNWRQSTGEKVQDFGDTELAEFQRFFAPFVAPLAGPSPRDDRVAEPGDLVWLVPHDALHYVPLHAVHLDGRYLGEHHPVCYTPSASVMRYCQQGRDRRRKSAQQRALILADSRRDRPLLHARDQARAVQRHFGPRAEVVLGDRATKELLTQRFAATDQPIDVLHVACHGYFSARQPLRSGILLAPPPGASFDGPEDEDPSSLTAEEIFGLRLEVSLVTLSACESGVNQRRPGDELIGLTRALLYAGAPSVVVSLWSVDVVSTSLLMDAFYRALLGHADKAEALRKAQLELRRATARDVIAHCEAVRQRLPEDERRAEGFVLDWDIADARCRAGDFAEALADYIRIQSAIDPASPDTRRLKRAIARCRLARPGAEPVDYDSLVFDHPYYWAPFVLVGDWR